jgi:hypothetical protein
VRLHNKFPGPCLVLVLRTSLITIYIQKLVSRSGGYSVLFSLHLTGAETRVVQNFAHQTRSRKDRRGEAASAKNTNQLKSGGKPLGFYQLYA